VDSVHNGPDYIKSDFLKMAQAQDIAGSGLTRTVSHSLSVSPTATFHSPPGGFSLGHGNLPSRAAPKQLKPFDTQDIKILLLENVNASGQELLHEQGYQVEFLKTSLPEDKLIEKIRYVWGLLCSIFS
jgi:D-3-phosphoglycerate dehydrogenase / 2-oxoglutarate reductase